MEAREGQRASADFVIPDAGLLEGRVSLAGHRPLYRPALVNVRLSSAANDFRAGTEIPVSADGKYQVHLPAGQYMVNAMLTREWSGSQAVPCTVEAGMVTREDVEIPDPRSPENIRIEIVDAGGDPAGQAVAIVRAGVGSHRMGRPLMADAEGVAVLGRWADLPVDELEITAALRGGRNGAPWQRVLARAERATRRSPSASRSAAGIERQALDAEGVEFDVRDRKSAPCRLPPASSAHAYSSSGERGQIEGQQAARRGLRRGCGRA